MLEPWDHNVGENRRLQLAQRQYSRRAQIMKAIFKPRSDDFGVLRERREL